MRRTSAVFKELILKPTGKPASIKDTTYATYLTQLYGAQSLPAYTENETFPDKTPQEKNVAFGLALSQNLAITTLLTAIDIYLVYAYTTKQKEHIEQ